MFKTFLKQQIVQFLWNLFNLTVVVNKHKLRFCGCFLDKRTCRKILWRKVLYFQTNCNRENKFSCVSCIKDSFFLFKPYYRASLNEVLQKTVVKSRKNIGHDFVYLITFYLFSWKSEELAQISSDTLNLARFIHKVDPDTTITWIKDVHFFSTRVFVAAQGLNFLKLLNHYELFLHFSQIFSVFIKVFVINVTEWH
jgi:hypothetical protein